MVSYYTVIIILLWLALGILCLLIWENDRLSHTDKRQFYLTFVLIALSSLAEWCAVQLNGRTYYPEWALTAAKCADFILTPMAGGAMVMLLRPAKIWRDILLGLLTFNTLLQLVSVFTGWMITVDESHCYKHGPGYGVYMVICMAIIVLVIITFILYGRQFRRQNRKSLYAIMLFVLIGTWLQEGLPGSYRTAYLVMTFGAAMLMIHYNEFSFLQLDDQVAVQKIQIDTDALTGLYSRYAYSQVLKAYGTSGMPDDLAVFILDINGLKEVNDNLGHDAGDELIVGAAKCIKKVLNGTGRCFRTGGDEFAVLANLSREQANDLAARFKQEAAQWHGERVESLHLAVGYALAVDFPEFGPERLLREADLAMYAAKAEFYSREGHNRRRSRR